MRYCVPCAFPGRRTICTRAWVSIWSRTDRWLGEGGPSVTVLVEWAVTIARETSDDPGFLRDLLWLFLCSSCCNLVHGSTPWVVGRLNTSDRSWFNFIVCDMSGVSRHADKHGLLGLGTVLDLLAVLGCVFVHVDRRCFSWSAASGGSVDVVYCSLVSCSLPSNPVGYEALD